MSLQFRVRGPAIQVVRTTTETGTKRPRIEPLGMIPQTGALVPAPLATKLTAEEAAQVADYVAGLQQAQALRAQLAARTINITAAEAARHLAGVRGTAEAAALVPLFEDALATLRTALKPPAETQRPQANRAQPPRRDA